MRIILGSHRFQHNSNLRLVGQRQTIIIRQWMNRSRLWVIRRSTRSILHRRPYIISIHRGMGMHRRSNGRRHGPLFGRMRRCRLHAVYHGWTGNVAFVGGIWFGGDGFGGSVILFGGCGWRRRFWIELLEEGAEIGVGGMTGEGGGGGGVVFFEGV